MARALELRSDELRVVLSPTLGARITSLTDRAGHEYVAAGSPPAANVTPAHSFLAGGLGGVDDCLPGITAESFGSPRRLVPDHGEVWSRPVTLLDATPQRIETVQRGIQADYELQRVFELQGAGLRVSYALENLTEAALDVLWAAHPLLPLTRDTELDLGPVDHVRVESGTFATAGETVTLRGDVDLTRPGRLPRGTCLKAFAPLPPGSTVGVSYPERGSRLSLRLEADHPAWLGIWINADGFPASAPVRHLALEPSFGDCDSLSQAITSGTCLRTPPRDTVTWQLDYSVESIQAAR